jgi:hypothetical protein
MEKSTTSGIVTVLSAFAVLSIMASLLIIPTTSATNSNSPFVSALSNPSKAEPLNWGGGWQDWDDSPWNRQFYYRHRFFGYPFWGGFYGGWNPWYSPGFFYRNRVISF